MNEKEIIGLNQLYRIFELTSDTSDNSRRYQAFIDYINHLIETDFSKLLAILYRVDVSEKKLKQAFTQEHRNAGEIIARLLIERELQKIETRKKYK